MAQPIPPPQFNVLTSKGYFSSPWYLYLVQFGQQPASIAMITPSGSPFTYMASTAGTLVISGGAVSSVVLTRSGTSVNMATSGNVPMVNQDSVTITYSSAPTVSFVPG